MISQLRLTPYRLTFKTPWRTHHGTRHQREGWIIELEDGAGHQGRGEVAPLEEIGTETIEAAEHKLQSLSALHYSSCEQLLQWIEPLREHYPALCCGIEGAVLQLQSAQRGLSLRQLLNRNSATQVRVNQLLTGFDSRQIDTTGASIIKLKLGIQPAADELKQLRELARQLAPGQQLRLDANQAWEPDEAREILRELEALPVESLEEPLQAPSAEAISALQQATSIPIAVDESMPQIGIDSLLQHPPRRLVLKPTRLGGPETCYRLARQFQPLGTEVVVTSALESRCGVTIAAHCAAAIDPQQQQAHGLATTALFVEQSKLALPLKNGILPLP